jgi:Chemoreceptor zinc-binding domain
MSLKKGMAGIFGLSRTPEQQKAKIHEEINLMDAINGHVKCKVHLQNYLEGRLKEQLDPMVICLDDRCVLGKWIHGPAFKHFHENPTFYQLRAFHAQMHVIAGNVIKHVLANERTAAEALMEEKYKEASRKVVKALAELNQRANA